MRKLDELAPVHGQTYLGLLSTNVSAKDDDRHKAFVDHVMVIGVSAAGPNHQKRQG